MPDDDTRSDGNTRGAPVTLPAGPAPLEPLYYLRNFDWVLRWVRERYGDLLNREEHGFIDTVLALPEPGRGLLVRMVMRKGDLFRPESLRYDELGDTERALAPLRARGWLTANSTVTPAELFRLFPWRDLALHRSGALEGALRAAGLTPRARKREALAAVCAHAPEPRPLSGWGLPPEAAFRLNVMRQCDRLRWLFFGNAHQDWSEFVLTELGLFRYEPVVFDEHSRPLHRREELDAYWRLLELRQQWEAEEAIPPDWSDRLPPEPGNNPWLARHYHRLLYKLARQREREGALDSARDLYEACDDPEARSRLIRVLERLGKDHEALRLARRALEAPGSEAQAQHAERVLPRLRRRLSGERQPRPAPPAVHTFSLTLPFQWPVEQAVQQHLNREDAPVYYTENTLLTGLLGLLCWEPVFTALPGAFFHPFQRGPADLHWPTFYQRRESALRDCLAQLDDGRYRETILRHYRTKWGRQSPFVVWEALPEPLLETALDGLPPAHLKTCFERILRDIKANRSGLPDLIRFGPGEGRYELIEVKGPGDRLQDNQKRWLAFFRQHGMPVSVCYVNWAERVS